MVITPQQAQNIVDEMKRSIHRDINIMDEAGIIIASTNPLRRGQTHQGAARIIREDLESLVIYEDDGAAGVQRGINLPILLHGDRIGVIGITGDPAEVSVFGRIIKQMTEIMLQRIQDQEQTDLLNRAKGLFIENWLFSEQLNWPEAELRGKLLGIDINAPYSVALLRLTDSRQSPRTEELDEIRSSRVLSLIRSQLQSEKKHYCAVLRSQIIVLLHGASRSAARTLIQKIRQSIESYDARQVRGGISSVSQGAADIRRCYLEAQAAASVAEQSQKSAIVFYDEASFEFVVQSVPRSFCRDLAGMVFSRCTASEQQEFSRLIQLYYQKNGDISACAEALFVHRNTVQYRMSQLRRKTGYELRYPKDALLLYLAAQQIE